MSFSPAEALGEDELSAIEQAEKASQGGGMLDTDNPIIKGLLSTKPDLDPEEQAGKLSVDLARGHAYVGMRKFIHGIGFKLAGSGTPAIANFGLALMHRMGDSNPQAPEGENNQAAPPEPDNGTPPGTLSPEEIANG